MSILLIAAISANQRSRIPILNMFILIYVGHWHLRYLTLLFWPEYQHVLTRTVIVDQGIFNEYSLLVLLALVAVFLGIFLAYRFTNAIREWSTSNAEISFVEISQFVSSRKHFISLYCFLLLCWQLAGLNCSMAADLRIHSYISLLFLPHILIFMCLIVLLTDSIAKNIKILFGSYLLVYLLFTLVGGNRGIFLFIFICLMGMLYLYKREIRLNLRGWIALIIIAISMVLCFFVASTIRSAQRFECEPGANLIHNLAKSVLEPAISHVSEPAISHVVANLEPAISHVMANPESVLGTAIARAGYLDFGAEMYANDKYADVINISSLAKSTIDNLIPGFLFEEGKISHRIATIYKPPRESYQKERSIQSDAITAIGENYLLFGKYSPIAIMFVAFMFTLTYSLSGNTLLGLWLKFVLMINLGTWWNSFGYDWLIQDIVLQIIFGSLVVAMIFYGTKIRH